MQNSMEWLGLQEMISSEDFFNSNLKAIDLSRLHRWLKSFGLEEENQFQLILEKENLTPITRLDFHKSGMRIPCYRFGAVFDFPKSFSALKYQLSYNDVTKNYNYFGKIWLISSCHSLDSNWGGFQVSGVRFLEPDNFNSIEDGLQKIYGFKS